MCYLNKSMLKGVSKKFILLPVVIFLALTTSVFFYIVFGAKKSYLSLKIKIENVQNPVNILISQKSNLLFDGKYESLSEKNINRENDTLILRIRDRPVILYYFPFTEKRVQLLTDNYFIILVKSQKGEEKEIIFDLRSEIDKKNLRPQKKLFYELKIFWNEMLDKNNIDGGNVF